MWKFDSSFHQGSKMNPTIEPNQSPEDAFQFLTAVLNSTDRVISLTFKGVNPFKNEGYYGRVKIDDKWRQVVYLSFDSSQIGFSKKKTVISVYDGKEEYYCCQVACSKSELPRRNVIAALAINDIYFLYKSYPAVEDSDENEVEIIAPQTASPSKKREREPEPLQLQDIEAADIEMVSTALSKNPRIIEMAVRKAFFDLLEKDLTTTLFNKNDVTYPIFRRVFDHIWDNMKDDQGKIDGLTISMLEKDSFRQAMRMKIQKIDLEKQQAMQERITAAAQKTTTINIDDQTIKGWTM